MIKSYRVFVDKEGIFMKWGLYVAVARSKEDNSIVRAVDFNTREEANNYIKKWKEVNPNNSVDLKVEECNYDHYEFWNRTRT